MKRFAVPSNLVHGGKLLAFLLLLSLVLSSPCALYGDKKKKDDDVKQAPPQTAQDKQLAIIATRPHYDFSKLFWPAPPNVTRVRYVDYFTGMPIDYGPVAKKKKEKQGWMDRLAGTPEGAEKQEKLLKDFPYQLIGPYGVACDSKGLVYVVDQKVGAIFVFNVETRVTELIKNGTDAHFEFINGIAIDDNDRIFVSDGKLAHVLVFDANHKVESIINEGMVDPNGLAIDIENRYLYVADTQQDQVLVYDADTFKLLRRIGGVGKKHTLTGPGDFAAPTNVALDSDENVYVTDTLNDRVEIFDADGNFISTFGKNCDGPGCFTRPKGIAVDSDGHIWVGDTMSDRLQVFNKEGQLLTYIGSHGPNLGQFKALEGVGFDKKRNLVFTTEYLPGRMQVFRYITDAEAAADKKRLEEERQKKYRQKAPAATTPAAKPEALAQPAAEAKQPATTSATAGAQGTAAK